MQLEKLQKYGVLNSHDVLKFVALVIMTIDHVGAYFAPDELWWRAVGRITFPVWFFLIGYARSTRIGTDLLWGFVVVLAANQFTYHPLFPMNALLSIIICRLCLRLADRYGLLEKHPMECLVALVFLNVPLILFWEYGMIAVMYAFAGRMVRLGLSGWKYKLFWVAITLVFLLYQAHFFAFDDAQLAFATFGTMAVCMVLFHYEMRDYALRLPRLCEATVKLLSRYSLQYYVVHRVVFQLIGAYVLHTHLLVGRLFYE